MQQGQQLKQIGLDLVEDHNPDFMDLARREARRICYQNGTVSSDDLRQWASERGIEPKHPNAWGAVFRVGFKKVGYKQAAWPSCHARNIAVWALR